MKGRTPGRLPGALPGCLLDNRDRRILRQLLQLNIAFFPERALSYYDTPLVTSQYSPATPILNENPALPCAVGLLLASLCQCAVLVEDDSDLSPVCQSYAVKQPCSLRAGL